LTQSEVINVHWRFTYEYNGKFLNDVRAEVINCDVVSPAWMTADVTVGQPINTGTQSNPNAMLDITIDGKGGYKTFIASVEHVVTYKAKIWGDGSSEHWRVTPHTTRLYLGTNNATRLKLYDGSRKLLSAFWMCTLVTVLIFSIVIVYRRFKIHRHFERPDCRKMAHVQEDEGILAALE